MAQNQPTANQQNVEPMEHQMSDNIPRNESIRNNQVENRAGGYAWKVDDIKRLHRSLVLGSEQAAYYTGERQLCVENAQAICRLVNAGKGVEVVNTIRIQLKTNQRAYEVLSNSKTLSGSGGSGWGRAPRKAIQKWYTRKSSKKVRVLGEICL